MGARPPPRLRATRSLPKSTGSGPGRGAGQGGWGEAGAGEAQPAALRHMILSLALASSQSRMWLSTPLSPRRGSGLFEFLTTWIESPPQQGQPTPEAASPQIVTTPDAGGGRALVHERRRSQEWLPRASPPSPPPVVHNPGRLFKEFSTLVLVIYLDSAHPARRRVTDPLPTPVPPQPRPWGRFPSLARQAWPCSRLLQMALLDIAGFQGTLESHFWGPSQPPNILWTLLLDPAGPLLPNQGGDR